MCGCKKVSANATQGPAWLPAHSLPLDMLLLLLLGPLLPSRADPAPAAALRAARQLWWLAVATFGTEQNRPLTLQHLVSSGKLMFAANGLNSLSAGQANREPGAETGCTSPQDATCTQHSSSKHTVAYGLSRRMIVVARCAAATGCAARHVWLLAAAAAAVSGVCLCAASAQLLHPPPLSSSAPHWAMSCLPLTGQTP